MSFFSSLYIIPLLAACSLHLCPPSSIAVPSLALGTSRPIEHRLHTSAPTMSSESSAVPADSAWLQQQLQQLLASPYIHFNHPPGIRMGHGPVDLFSTRFNNLFAPDASGTVAGTDADRAALKQALLALQKHWSPDSASFAPATGLQDGQVRHSYGGPALPMMAELGRRYAGRHPRRVDASELG